MEGKLRDNKPLRISLNLLGVTIDRFVAGENAIG